MLVVLLAGVVPVNAQDVTEVTLKGAFLFNFARFTDWPADALPSATTVTACVVADRAVGAALARAVSGQLLDGRPVVVAVLEPSDPLPVCHLVYVSGLARSRMAEIVSELRDMPVLTVSDDGAFIKAGGIIQVVIENGRLRFRINSRSAKRARLQLSSRLLALAEVVDQDLPQPAFAGSASQAR